MSKYKNRSRKLARDSYWEKHDRRTYQCPDCGRTEDELSQGFEVHHKNGEPLDNRPENQVALCRLCHNLREGKKPSIEQIRQVRDSAFSNQVSSPVYPLEVFCFVEDRAKEPSDPPYADVAGVWWDFFTSYCENSRSERFNAEADMIVDLLRALKQEAGAEIKYTVHGVEVWGVEPS